MEDNILGFPEPPQAPDLKGAMRTGYNVIVDGRAIPDMHMYEEGGDICFVLDNRLAFSFPREMAHQAAAFAANAMAIGAGYPSIIGEAKHKRFAPQCMEISLPDGET